MAKVAQVLSLILLLAVSHTFARPAHQKREIIVDRQGFYLGGGSNANIREASQRFDVGGPIGDPWIGPFSHPIENVARGILVPGIAGFGIGMGPGGIGLAGGAPIATARSALGASAGMADSMGMGGMGGMGGMAGMGMSGMAGMGMSGMAGMGMSGMGGMSGFGGVGAGMSGNGLASEMGMGGGINQMDLLQSQQLQLQAQQQAQLQAQQQALQQQQQSALQAQQQQAALQAQQQQQAMQAQQQAALQQQQQSALQAQQQQLINMQAAAAQLQPTVAAASAATGHAPQSFTIVFVQGAAGTQPQTLFKMGVPQEYPSGYQPTPQ